MLVLNIITIIVSISSIVVNIWISMIKKPLSFDAENIEVDDSFDMLFDSDGHANDEVTVPCANYNNQDVLLYLQDGYIPVKNKSKDVYELYYVKKQYFTLKANSMSDIKIKVNVGAVKDTVTSSKIFLKFKYYNGMRMKTFMYKKRGSER